MKVFSLAFIGTHKSLRHLPKFYAGQEIPEIGDLVEAPLKSERGEGIVMYVSEEEDSDYKTLGKIVKKNVFSSKYIEWLSLSARRFFCHPSLFLQKMFLPSEKKNLAEATFPTCASGQFFSEELFLGFHFSGKNLELVQRIKKTLEQKLPVLFIVPSYLALFQVHKKFSEIFEHANIATVHSFITEKQKKKIHKSLANNEIDIIIGTPQSICLPFSRLGLIVLHEYADDSYADLLSPFVHWGDVARLFAKIFSIPMILSSNIGKIEDLANHALQKKEFPELFPMPITIADMRLEKANKNELPLSAVALHAIGSALDRKHQSIVHINRKGLHWTMICVNCGYSPVSPFSGLKMGVFQNQKTGTQFLKCSTSGYTESLKLKCPECQGDWTMVGSGTQDVEHLLSSYFPTAKVVRADKDVLSTKRKMEDFITQVESKNVDIIVGTSFALKGFAFSHVSTVVEVNADLALMIPQIGGEEHALGKLRQLVDKIGNAIHPVAILQTSIPTHPVYALLQAKSDDLLRRYFPQRQQFFHPPFSRVVRLVSRAKRKETVEKHLAEYVHTYSTWFFHLFAPRVQFFEKTQAYEGFVEGFLRPEYEEMLFESRAEVEVRK